ncbi:DUF4369 domain-containing protein [Formosa sp. S-31]|uniref:DUF4369 domain-containing protein n=1 Tax=Formosa sp. S-31 TaxID=2790949 RepID=UPI003EBA53B7
MKQLTFILGLLLAVSCGRDTGNLTVKTHVKGLKKGTVYLQKADDSIIVNVDSVTVNGNEDFELYANVESPEVFFLKLDKNDNTNEKILFFGEPGEITINTTLKNFTIDSKVTGSKNQDILEDYLLVMSKLNNSKLDLIKEDFEARQSGDSLRIKKAVDAANNLIKRKYLYTVNFAMNNKDSEVAPYLALTEIYDANIKWLDTINNTLTPKVKASKYGKELQHYIDEIKE